MPAELYVHFRLPAPHAKKLRALAELHGVSPSLAAPTKSGSLAIRVPPIREVSRRSGAQTSVRMVLAIHSVVNRGTLKLPLKSRVLHRFLRLGRGAYQNNPPPRLQLREHVPDGRPGASRGRVIA